MSRALPIPPVLAVQFFSVVCAQLFLMFVDMQLHKRFGDDPRLRI